MKNWKETYQEKLLSVSEAATKIESGDRIFVGPAVAMPLQLMEAITLRYKELADVQLISGLPLNPLEFLKSPDYKGHIHWNTIFFGPYERPFIKNGNISINSVPLSKVNMSIRDYYKANVLITEVSEPDDEGYLYLGPAGVMVCGDVADYVKKIIVQVNRHQKKVKGVKHRLHVNEVSYICEADHELSVLPQSEVTDIERKIAGFLLPHIPDGCTIQFGIGGLSNAVGYGLETKKNLSVHTEMMCESMVYLAKKGVITGRFVAGQGLGSQELYDFIGDGRVELMPFSIVNDPNVIGQHDNFISINNCLMADLTGQICSESFGHTQFSSIGGQLDFVRGAAKSKGGKSFLCMGSTARTKDGQLISTINCNLPAGAVVTTPRADVMFVVTEYGIAELYHRSIPDRVHAMISIAHPDFKDELRQQAIHAGLIRE